MTTSAAPHVLVLGGTGKTGRRVARRLGEAGQPVRVAARSGADVRFDWDDSTTHAAALAGADRLYLVPPAASVTFAGQVAEFLDQAAATGVRHVTYLSAWGVQHAPAEVALRAVELHLQQQTAFTASVVRPAWFMENFTESFLLPGVLARGQVVAPTGAGAEAFISAEDIAAVAAATLTDPAAHAGAAYDVAGPAALTFADAAAVIAEVTGRPVEHLDIAGDAWVAATREAGMPADYAAMLGSLFENISRGAGAVPTSVVRQVLGRDPLDFTDFAKAHVDVWTPVNAVRS